jgi:hypothetical protein
MTLEIYVLAWDGHKNVSGLNGLFHHLQQCIRLYIKCIYFSITCIVNVNETMFWVFLCIDYKAYVTIYYYINEICLMISAPIISN